MSALIGRWAVPREALPGVVLMAAAVLAMIAANSPLDATYDQLLTMRIAIEAGEFRLAKPFLLWINEGLMAIFFFLVGLELKRELLYGELSSPARRMLPALAAAGGMAVPAALYASINHGDALAIRGWAIPAATDIAFALGVLLLLGSRVPASLRVFLTAVAIVDDLGAIVVIALFYSADLAPGMLIGAAVALCALGVLNRCRVRSLAPFVLLGAVLWLCVLKSGVHATLAGLMTALAIPHAPADGETAPAARAEHALQPWVAYLVVPLFAFANAGVSLAGVSPAVLLEPVPLGIALGLFVGKALGVFAASVVAIRFLGAALPSGSSWAHLFGVCMLAGIGFTMSLFIGALAFEESPGAYGDAVKLGVLAGSVLSAIGGSTLLLILARGTRR